jgi:Alpha/beta hydrolase domain
MPSSPETRSATLSGPVPGAPFLGQPTSYDLAALGYSNEEYFLAGTARSYAGAAPEAAYRTRAVVRRPLDAARFNGSVVVEWFNVSGGLDAAPDWGFVHRHLMREGFAWVGVSVQKVGIEGGGFAAISMPLKKMNAERYGSLSHPGDAFAFDIFSQAGRAVRDGRLLGGLAPKRVLAIGESQSAMYLVTYVNRVDADARVFDGFLIHGRGGSGAPLDGSPAIRAPIKETAAAVSSGRGAASLLAGSDRIRDDVRVPVITVQSETDVVGLGSVGARQDDAPRFRLWEIAGAAHADMYLLVASGLDDGTLPPAELARLLAPTDSVFGMKMGAPMNAGPQQHYVLQAALAHLERWAAGGSPPPTAPRLELADGGASPFALDASGLVRGGLRTPWVDAPTAVLSGLGQSGAEFAFLFGTTRPLGPGARARLYPGGRPDFLARFAKASDEAVAAGFLLEADREEIRAVAALTPW